jgi:lipoprotein
MKSTVKKIVTAGLGAVLLSVICMLIACTDAPDSSEYEAEKIDGGVSLIVKRDRQVIDIYAVTSDKKPVTVPIKGGIPLRIESGAPTSIPLIQTGTRLILKGNIIELTCTNNDLTALNVQGVPALQKLDCSGNELT